jgi:tripartite-type tricarboxylate transporter receptor subunit TctC
VLCLSALAVVALPNPANAQKSRYPEKNITAIVMWPAGGGADTAMRFFTKQLEKIVGRTIIVQNMPGGGGSIGYIAAKNARPDGYTLVNIQGDLPKYKPMGLAPIDISDYDILGGFGFQAPIIVARADAPWNSIKDFVEDAKKRPGKLTAGITDISGTYHQPLVLWMDGAGFNIKAIVQEGSPQQTAALLGGHVDVNVTWIRPNIPYVKEGKLKFLGYMGAERTPDFPNVPTFKELGYDIVWEHPYGIGGPKGIPEDVKAVLSEATKKIWEIPEFKRDAENLGLYVFKKDGPAYTKHLLKMQEDMGKALRLIKEQPK